MKRKDGLPKKRRKLKLNDWVVCGDYSFFNVYRKNILYKILIDTEDLNRVKQFTWHIQESNNKYAKTNMGYPHTGTKHGISLHRLIMSFPEGYDIDHASGDTLDNRKTNLRIVTESQNTVNRGINKSHSIGLKGVRKSYNKFQARISRGGVTLHLGSFSSPEEAHARYKEEDIKISGDFSFYRRK